MESEVSLPKNPGIKFHENPFSGANRIMRSSIISALYQILLG
jgi:hypothetical protein